MPQKERNYISVNRHAFTLVEIMIVVAIIALLAAIAVPGLLRAKVVANDSAAQGTLKAIANAYEAYAAANSGNYPATEGALTSVTPPYIGRIYNGTTSGGYNYTVTVAAGGYSVVAAANTKGQSGSVTNYYITTGGILATTP